MLSFNYYFGFALKLSDVLNKLPRGLSPNPNNLSVDFYYFLVKSLLIF
jgi:hypothetical protein